MSTYVATESTAKQFNSLKIHPDLLFAMPNNLGFFSKNLITTARSQNIDAGISSYENNCISFESHIDSFNEKVICLQSKLFYDYSTFEYSVAFNAFNLLNDELLQIADTITSLINKPVYLNLNNRRHPNFENLVESYAYLNLFNDYSQEDKIKYSQTNILDIQPF